MVICKLPKAGLGNQLFPLMRAAVFAHLNHLPLRVVNYHQLKIGPWLRNERSKRNYRGFFKFQKNIVEEALDKLSLKVIGRRGQTVEPEVIIRTGEDKNIQTFLFFKMPHYTEYFKGLDIHRPLVIQLLNEMISSTIHRQINAHKTPVIGIHVRMGDFMKPGREEELGQRGSLRTPLQYFIRTIQEIRNLKNEVLPVTIFSDGSREELAVLLKLPEVSLSNGKNDLVDLILLSKSKIIVTSAGSTFSYWAGFISDAIVIMHPTYTGIKIRPGNMRDSLYEGAFDKKSEQMIKAIHGIGF
jgi:hypothetical protein